jgi:hypothetical protein
VVIKIKIKMKKDKYNDFTASYIFSYDNEGNTLYKRKGKVYIINDSTKQTKLKELEGYNYFLYGNGNSRVIGLFLTTLFIGFPLFMILIYFGYIDEDNKYSRGMPFLLGLPFYLFLIFLQNYKINKLLENEPVVKEYKNDTILNNDKYIDNSNKNSGYLNELKSILPDMNIYHIILFIMIAFPFFYFIFILIFTS